VGRQIERETVGVRGVGGEGGVSWINPTIIIGKRYGCV